jgi:hypothetical protein
MARKVFFSFHYARDAWRVSQIRNVNAISRVEKTPFLDAAGWEQVRRQGDAAVRKWIDDQLKGTSVTVVLVGKETSTRPWVKYEIDQSIKLGKGLFAIDISKIKDQHGATDDNGANPLPNQYPLYRWNKDNGTENIANWIEEAASEAGR